MLSLLLPAFAGAFSIGGGAPVDLTARFGFGADLDRIHVLPPELGPRPRRTMLDELVINGSFTLPYLLVEGELFGGRTHQDLGFLVTDRVRSGNNDDVGPVDFMAHSRRASVFLGLGEQWGNDTGEVRLTAGPTLGAGGFGDGTKKRFQAVGLRPDPSPFHVGARMRLRARYQLGDRVALEGRTDGSIGRTINPGTYLRGDEGEELVHPDISTQALQTAGEVQARVVKGLWWTLGASFESEHSSQKPTEVRPGFDNWNHSVRAHAGVRWR